MKLGGNLGPSRRKKYFEVVVIQTQTQFTELFRDLLILQDGAISHILSYNFSTDLDDIFRKGWVMAQRRSEKISVVI